MTTRQLRTAAAYYFGAARVRPTYQQIGCRFGVKKSAICQRLKRFSLALPPDQRMRYLRLAAMNRQKTRRWLLQLNAMDNI
jgi:hypothetical protein